MKCPICGSEAVQQENNNWCPTCKIYLGKDLNIKPDQKPKQETGEVYRKRARKSKLLGILVGLVFLIIIAGGAFFFTWNYTAFGFREQIMRDYGFTEEAKWYLRKNTSIQVRNINNKGLGKQVGAHPDNRYEIGDTTVKLASANEEIAMHELAHAWWEHVRYDEEFKKGLVKDTIKLSKMDDPNYEQSIILATATVTSFCNCPDQKKIDLEKVDDHHFYADPVHFMLGKFKDGPRKLPPFMWKYFEGQFTSDLRVVPCYELNNCVSMEIRKDRFCKKFPERKMCEENKNKQGDR